MKYIIDYITNTLLLTIAGLGIAAIAGLMALFAPLLSLLALEID